MKTQTYGFAEWREAYPFGFLRVLSPLANAMFWTAQYTIFLPITLMSARNYPGPDTIQDFIKISPAAAYRTERENGLEIDNPDEPFPYDGHCSWEKKPASTGTTQLERVRYDEGPKDRAWMEKNDRNYQARLVRERLTKTAELKTAVTNEIVSSVYKIHFSELIATINDQTETRAQDFEWYTHPDLPPSTPPYDYQFTVDEMAGLFNAIRDNSEIKTLNLSTLDLSGELRPLIIKLFRARNDFAVINLANTRLTNEGLDELLNALYDGKDTTRNAPLIEKFNIADNQITSIHLLIDFIYNCVRAHYFQDLSTASISPLPLVKVNLRCNLILLTENSDSILRKCVEQLQERYDALGTLTIRISGNIIQINVPNPFQEIRRNVWQNGFFVTKQIERRQSIMLTDTALTPTDGFVYLVCAKKSKGAMLYFGHASIFTERLDLKGQLEIKKLEFGLPAACGTSGGGGINIEQLDALRLMHGRGKLNFQAWPIKSYLIQQLIDNVEGSSMSDVAKYSSLAIRGENCTTWAIDKLKAIGLEVDETIFPTKAAGAGKGCALM